MFSGKSAVSDFIREHNGFYVPNYRVEFDLVRMPHGLLDLKHALVDDWSWVRSDKAIRQFVELTSVLSRNPKNLYQKIFNFGFGYSAKYKNFIDNTDKFINNITNYRWAMPWPYELVSFGPLQIARLKIVGKIMRTSTWPTICYHLSSGENFLIHAKNYLHNILVDDKISLSFHTVVTHNMLEPYNPSAGFCFFDNIKSIAVDRDIRDIYMTSVVHSDGLNDNVELYSKIIGSFDIDIFIKRQKILRENTNYENHANILRMKYEDLVLNYDLQAGLIRNFLKISETDHNDKMKFFNPELSLKNVGLWKSANSSQVKIISRLERDLPELCYS